MATATDPKRVIRLSADEKEFLRDALHTEGALSGNYLLAVRIRRKLGLGPLAREDEE